jgi:hypothetical protein
MESYGNGARWYTDANGVGPYTKTERLDDYHRYDSNSKISAKRVQKDKQEKRKWERLATMIIRALFLVLLGYLLPFWVGYKASSLMRSKTANETNIYSKSELLLSNPHDSQDKMEKN